MGETLASEDSYEHRRRLFRSIWQSGAERPTEEREIIRTARLDESRCNFRYQEKKRKIRNITMACKRILKLRSNHHNNDKEHITEQVPEGDKQKPEDTAAKESKIRSLTPTARRKRKVLRKRRHKEDIEINKEHYNILFKMEYPLKKDFSPASLPYSNSSMSPKPPEHIMVNEKPIPEEKSTSVRIIVNKVQDFVKIQQKVAKRAMSIALRSIKTNKPPREIIEKYKLPLSIVNINF